MLIAKQTPRLRGIRRLLLVFLILGLGLPAPAAAEVKIGLYLPMTGTAAAMGQMVWEGVQVAHRLKPRVLGQPVQLSLVDTKSDKIEAANGVSRLIEKDKVAAIIGEVISSDTLAGTRNFPGVTGKITMGPDHNPLKGVVIIKVENGKFAYQATINP